MIEITQKGNFNTTEMWLRRLKDNERMAILNRYGSIGVNALSNATPIESGETAASWFYTIQQRPGYYSIRWHNRHEEDGVNIAVILQYGHGTGTGGYVQGRDYIMPAIRPILEQIADEAWKAVISV